MVYRRKAPAAKSLSTTQLLSKICNGHAGAYPFQTHNAIALLRFLQEHHKSVYDGFATQAAVQLFYPKWSVDGANVKEGATAVNLPLPARFLDAEITTADFDPRAFYHSSALVKPPSQKQTHSGVYFPRCGHSGLFFSREEVVDNLQAAAADLSFTSPFWLRSSHQALASGFLKLRDDSEAICISLSDSVVSIADVENFDAKLLHPSITDAAATGSAPNRIARDAPIGANALTGYVSANPFFQDLPHRGVWLSHDQLLGHHLIVTAARAQQTGTFTLVETEQWELYNADQLTQPGRLALRTCVQTSNEGGVFQPA